MRAERLYVHFEGRLVGQLTLLESMRLQFEYASAWRESAAAFPISISLPLDGDFDPAAGGKFFGNLLPEGNVRLSICRTLGISAENDFALLKAIGGDCAGALTITTQKSPPRQSAAPAFQEVTAEQLSAWSVGAPAAFSAVTGRGGIRLSLAGAQDKLPVLLNDGRICIPMGSTPGTHLLKFASPLCSHLPENEALITMLAKAVGLPVAEIVLYPTSRARVALITRYDRIHDQRGVRRLHQEDFCQALGLSAACKYEQEGGPGFGHCADILRAHSSFPLIDLQQFIQWALFNLLIGNADAHGKNLSLLHGSSGALRLAPFYDLVCTRNYARLSRDLAMRFGGTADRGKVTLRQLEAFAAAVKVNAATVFVTAERLCDQLTAVISDSVREFRERFGGSPVLERIPPIIRKQIRWLRQQLQQA